MREVKRAAAFVSLVFIAFVFFLQGWVVFIANVPMALLDDRGQEIADLGSGISGFDDFRAYDALRMMAAAATQNAAFALTVVVGVWKLLLLVILHTTRQRGEPSPYYHTPWVGGKQWSINRTAQDVDDDKERTRLAFEQNNDGNGTPTHHMGYAVDAEGSYMLDDDGNYALGPGVQYVFDADGNYAVDGFGNCLLEDASGVLIVEGYGVDGYGGFVPDGASRGCGDYVASTSRSADAFNLAGLVDGDGDPSGHEGEVAPGEMLWAVCQQRAIFTGPDGVPGVFVTLPPSPGHPPLLFLQVHEQHPVKRARFGSKSNVQVRISFLSVEVGVYGLGRDYVEAHVSNDPQAAYGRLQAAQLETDAGLVDAYDGDYVAEGDTSALPAAPEALVPIDTAQRL